MVLEYDEDDHILPSGNINAGWRVNDDHVINRRRLRMLELNDGLDSVIER